MFGIHSSKGYQPILDGIKIKTVNNGPNMVMTEFVLKKGTVLPEHTHPNEQSGYLIKGKIRLFIDGKSHEMNPGDNWDIQCGIPHKAEILKDSIAIEVFSPIRKDYLQYLNKADIIE